MFFPYLESSLESTIPIVSVIQSDLAQWLEQQDSTLRNWVTHLDFNAKPETFCCIPASDGSGRIRQVYDQSCSR